jgi:hypothetical protein
MGPWGVEHNTYTNYSQSNFWHTGSQSTPELPDRNATSTPSEDI